jgi:hypothetical protein
MPGTPSPTLIAFLVNPTSELYTQAEIRKAQTAVSLIAGVRLLALKASDEPSIEDDFATLVGQHAGAVLVTSAHAIACVPRGPSVIGKGLNVIWQSPAQPTTFSMSPKIAIAYCNSSSNTFASLRSGVSKPSVNQS